MVDSKIQYDPVRWGPETIMLEEEKEEVRFLSSLRDDNA